MSTRSFLEFRDQHAAELRELEIFLDRAAPDDPVALRQEIVKAVAARSRAGTITGWAVTFHKEARAKYLKPKDFGPVLDREVRLEADTVDERRYRELWESKVKSLEIYISCGQTIMNQHTAEIRVLSAGQG